MLFTVVLLFFACLNFNIFLLCFDCVQRSAADSILRDLQNNPDMWLQVMHILQNTQNLNTKFFALQVCLLFIKPLLDLLLPTKY